MGIATRLTLAVPLVGVDRAVVLDPAVGEGDEHDRENATCRGVASLRLAVLKHELQERLELVLVIQEL